LQVLWLSITDAYWRNKDAQSCRKKPKHLIIKVSKEQLLDSF